MKQSMSQSVINSNSGITCQPCIMNRIITNLKENWIKYGFETLAITVGILGAFALENWKDDKQEEKELIEIYKTISEDLQSEILALDTILREFEWRTHIMLQILTEPPSIDNWVNNDSLALSFLGYPEFLENQRGLDLLKSKVAITGETGILAGRISDFYRKRLLMNESTREEFSSFFYENLKYWMGNGEWLSFFVLESKLLHR